MMNKPALLFVRLLFFGFFPVAGSLVAVTDAQDDSSNSGVLVDAEWLEKNLDDPNVRLIGLGQTQEQYELAHIPNEAFVEWMTEISDPGQPDRFNLPTKRQLEKLLRRMGVTKRMTIVLSDNLSSRLSTRMFWILRTYGHQNVRLLDGGRKAWIQSGRDFTKSVPKFVPSTYSLPKFSDAHYANLNDVKKCVEDQSAILIDGRPANQFSGEIPGKTFHAGKEHQRKGHIEGARNVMWADNFDEDGRFKSPAELKKLYAASNATKDKEIITYCNEGLHAAPPWFVLTELLDYPDVKLYDDSMAEWANRTDTPMATSQEKNK